MAARDRRRSSAPAALTGLALVAIAAFALGRLSARRAAAVAASGAERVELAAGPGAHGAGAGPGVRAGTSRRDPAGGSPGAPAGGAGVAPGSRAGVELADELRATGLQRPAPRAIDAALQTRIGARVTAAIADARAAAPERVGPGEVTVAVHVRELGRPGEVASLAADRALLPASNMKLATSAAALVLLGAGWSFETRFEAAGELSGGVLRGDLVVRAGGDPLLPAPDGPADAPIAARLAPVVQELARAGISRVAGRLVLDEGTYPVPAPGPSWPSPDQHWKDYCALAGGFSANGGCLTATVHAGEPGRAARVRVVPRDHGLEPRLAVTTVARKQPLTVAVEARAGRAVVRGEVPADVPEWSASFRHPDPVELFGSVLAGALAEAGIAVDGGVVRERGAPGGRLVAVLRTPLEHVLAPINTDSHNAVADQLFLAMGEAVLGAGTREAGRQATAVALERLGVPTEGLVQVDGSGLSRDDRLTARQLTALLDAVLAPGDATSERFLASLAVGGETGTLAGRLTAPTTRGRVHAKTGWISGASALSGQVTTLSGRRLVFAILVGYPRVGGLNTRCWKPLQDDVCALLAEWAP